VAGGSVGEAPAPERRSRLGLAGWLTIIVVCAGLLAGAAYRFNPFHKATNAPPPAPPIAVTAVMAATSKVQDQLTFVGSLIASQRITISPYTSGHVTEILVPDGASVVAGSPLYRLDDRTARAELALADGKLALKAAKLERDRSLQRDGFLAQVSLGSTAADVAEAEVDRGVKHVNLDLLTIKAPFAGEIGRHKVTLGQYVSPGDAMVDLVAQDSIAVDFHVPERRLAQVRQGAAIGFQSDALGDKAFAGAVSFIAGTVDPKTRTFAVLATIDNKDRVLRPGLFGRVDLAVGAPREAIVLPESALIQQLTGASVYRVVDGRAKLTPVETGTRTAAGVEITQGLAAGDQVIASGQFRLREGNAVSVLKAGAL
jgi:RND family efflux transporter MFP subunit